METVERLRCLALDACYDDILTSLALCREHFVVDSSRFSESVATFQLEKSSLSSAKRPLDGQVVGSVLRDRFRRNAVGQDIRGELLAKLCQELSSYCRRDIDKLQWPFIHTVTDEHCNEIDVHVGGCDDRPFPNAIKRLAERSPKLNKLSLIFDSTYDGLPVKCIDRIANVSRVTFLNNLTHLKLEGGVDYWREYLGLIGFSCPNLTNLTLHGLVLSDEGILRIFFGENSWAVRKRGSKKEYHKYQSDSDRLPPFCRTLQRVQLGQMEENLPSVSGLLSPSVIGLVLRHLPALLEFSYGGSHACTAVKLLFASSRSTSRPVKTAAKRRRVDSPSDLPNQIPFSGSLSLESLQWLNLGDKETLKAVTSLCPMVKKLFLTNPSGREVTSELLWMFRNNWPKVDSLVLNDIDPASQRGLVRTFGAQLVELTLSSCGDINPVILANCERLETLNIVNGCSFAKDAKVPPGAFLSSLKKIRSEVCLGQFAEESFLEKSSLVDVDVFCFGLYSTGEEWKSIGKLWPSLQSLCLHYCEGLDGSAVGDIFPSCPRLRNLLLPAHLFFGRTEEWSEKGNRLLSRAVTSLQSNKIQMNLIQGSYDWIDDSVYDLPCCNICLQ